MYQKINFYHNFTQTMRLKLLSFAFLMCTITPLTVSAVVVEGLFEVKIPVIDESQEVRRTALDNGLIEVLIRVSGNSDILKKIEAPAADSYVKRYEYLTQAAEVAGGTSSQQLWVRYNPTRILDFLRKQAVPIWGERRNQAVTWLAVRDGSQRFIMKNDDSSLIKSKVDAAFGRRGIPAIWPKMNAMDQKNVRFADILLGFTDPVKHASKRYSSGPIIMANMDWNGSEWKGEWMLLIADDVKKWSLSGVDYVALIDKAANLIADVMGQKYAVLEAFDASQHQQVAIEVDRVESVEKFRDIEKYLLSLSAVQSVQLSQVEPNRVFFNLILRSQVDDFLNQVQPGSMMTLLSDDVINESNEKMNEESPAEQVTLDASENPTANITITDDGTKTAAALALKPKAYRFVLQ